MIVVSSDSGVIDRCERWCNVAREIVTAQVSGAVRVSTDLFLFPLILRRASLSTFSLSSFPTIGSLLVNPPRPRLRT